MKLRNLGLVLCASGALFAAACSSDDDSGSNNTGGGGSSGKGGASGAAGKSGGGGKGGGTAGNDNAGTGNEAGVIDTAGTGNESGAGGEGGSSNTETFTVTLENVAPVKAVTSSGVFDTPFGSTAVGPAIPGQAYHFTVDAGRKQKLHFATMLAATNDLFFGPDGDGIALYDDAGAPLGTTATPVDVTSKVYLWDAGTELNQLPFIGDTTVGNQTAANTGPVDTDTKVRKIGDNTAGVTYAYPAVNTLLNVTIAHTTGTNFDVVIQVLANAALVLPGDVNTSHPVPISPGVWAVSGNANPLFTAGVAAPAHGLEALAEDGKAATLGTYLAANAGITYPASPGVWLVHTSGTKPLFTTGTADAGKGLEAIAEDGNPATLGTNLASLDGYLTGAIFNKPVGSATASAIVPGAKYTFTFDANPGDSLSFASMLAATNDVFFAPAAGGIALFDADGVALTGDVSDQVSLWDAGTEANEEPGIGPNTVTNQLAANTGTAGEGKVQLLSAVTTDTYPYPTPQSVLKVTIATK